MMLNCSLIIITFLPLSCLSEEFTRAVYVATGIKLTQHLVNTVFKIFDEDRDNKLSHKEFIGVMKERLHRGDGVRKHYLKAIEGPVFSLILAWLSILSYQKWRS